MTVANRALEDKLAKLITKLDELKSSKPNDLQPMRDVVDSMHDQGMEASRFMENLIELAKAVIKVRKTAVEKDDLSPLQRLPVPPYDLWLRFVDSDPPTISDEDLATASRIFKDKIFDLALRLRSPEGGKEAEVDRIADSLADNEIFISYSRKDREWLDVLKRNLAPFESINVNGSDMFWDDSKIRQGEEWSNEIDTALARAKAAVLLVTPDFLASQFIKERELPLLLLKAQRKELRLLWIHVRPSSYERTRFWGYQCLNDPKIPLTHFQPSQQEQELVRICESIFSAISSLPKTLTARI